MSDDDALSMIKASKFLPLVAAGCLLGACGEKFTGVYANMDGSTRYEFLADGKVHVSVLTAHVTGEFEVTRDRVLVTSPQGVLLLVRQDDRLVGPMGLELSRQPD